MRGDGEEPPVKTLELAAGFLIARLSAEHIEEMTGSNNGLADSGNVGPNDVGGERYGGNLVGLGGVVAGEMELALEIGLGHLDISHSHADVAVPQQLHEGGKTDAEAKHLGGEAVAQAVRGHRAGATRSFTGIG